MTICQLSVIFLLFPLNCVQIPVLPLRPVLENGCWAWWEWPADVTILYIFTTVHWNEVLAAVVSNCQSLHSTIHAYKLNDCKNARERYRGLSSHACIPLSTSTSTSSLINSISCFSLILLQKAPIILRQLLQLVFVVVFMRWIFVDFVADIGRGYPLIRKKCVSQYNIGPGTGWDYLYAFL